MRGDEVEATVTKSVFSAVESNHAELGRFRIRVHWDRAGFGDLVAVVAIPGGRIIAIAVVAQVHFLVVSRVSTSHTDDFAPDAVSDFRGIVKNHSRGHDKVERLIREGRGTRRRLSSAL